MMRFTCKLIQNVKSANVYKPYLPQNIFKNKILVENTKKCMYTIGKNRNRQKTLHPTPYIYTLQLKIVSHRNSI